MAQKLIFINDVNDLQILNIKELKSLEYKIFSFNMSGHKILEQNNIEHEIADNLLSINERLQLFDFITNYHNWYEQKPLLNELEFEGVNLLGLLDVHEFYHFLMPEIRKFLIIKKIIEKEKPEKIIVTTPLSTMTELLIGKKNIHAEIRNIPLTKSLHWDKVTIKFNVGTFPLSFNLSWTNYTKIKNLLESTLCRVFYLWHDFSNKRKAILLLEFNPSAYSNLLSDLAKYDKNIILLNRRRSAFWNLESINTIRKNKCKLLNLQKLLDDDDKKQIFSLTKHYLQNLEKLWTNDNFFNDLFSLEGHSFWFMIKDVMIDTYKKRIGEYVEFVIMAKKIFEKINISCIVSLNQIGTTEKTILNMNKKQITSVLLEHGYSNYIPDTSRFDITSYPQCLKDKIAVWGDVQKEYLTKHKKMDPNRILSIGSPRHDSFFKRKNLKKSHKYKTILIAPHPIVEMTGQSDTNTYIRFEKLIKSICSIIKALPNTKIIVKLHPSQLEHNNDIKELFREIDATIPVYHLKPIIELIESSDAVLTISPEGYDPSTIILESLILNKPTMNIVLDDNLYEFQYVKDNAIISLSDKSDLSQSISDILFNEKIRTKLIDNGVLHISNFLNNRGKASEVLANLLTSY